MKRFERILGIIGISLLVLGVLFKKMHWPSAGIQMILAVLLFNFGYLPMNLYRSWRESGTAMQKSGSLLKFLMIFALLTGFIFKLMHWPGAGFAMKAGFYLLPLYLIFYFFLRAAKLARLPFLLDDLLITLLAFTIYIFQTTRLVSPGVALGYIGLEDRLVKVNAGLMSSNRMIYESLDSLTASANEKIMASIGDLHEISMEFHNAADEIKGGFYRSILGASYRQQTNHRRMGIESAADMEHGRLYFIEKGHGREVQQLVEEYKKEMARIASIHNIPPGQIIRGLQTRGRINRWGEQVSWDFYMFGRKPVGAVIVNMSWVKQMALMAESNLLNGLISRIDLSEEVKLLQELAAKESEQAIALKENEIVRVRQEQELQAIQLEQSQDELQQNRMLMIFSFGGIALVLVLLSISTRAYVRKQRDNKKLSEQKAQIEEANEELNQQNEEISAQRDEIEAQRDLVSRQKEQIEKTHAEISASIDYATRLQTSILPGKDLLKEKFRDHFVFFRPKQKVSGDFYWWTEVEGRVIITAVDCTGHGVPGAFMSMLGVSLLREIVDREFVTKPDVILRRLRKEVIRSLDQKGEIGEQRDGMELALLSIDPGTLKCEYAGANNPFYVVRNGDLIEYKPDRMPVSFYQRMDKFTSREIQLREGDQIYLFSDGYADQFGGPNRKKFKYTAFKQHLTDHAGKPMEEQHRALEDTIKEWQGAYEQIDDMVVVGIRL